MCMYGGCDEDHRDEIEEMTNHAFVPWTTPSGRIRCHVCGGYRADHREGRICPAHGYPEQYITELGRPFWACRECLEPDYSTDENGDELVPAEGEEGVEYTSDTARSEGW